MPLNFLQDSTINAYEMRERMIFHKRLLTIKIPKGIPIAIGTNQSEIRNLKSKIHTQAL